MPTPPQGDAVAVVDLEVAAAEAAAAEEHASQPAPGRKKKPGSMSVPIDDFPERLRPLLRDVDTSGDGQLEVHELEEVFRMYIEIQEAQKQGMVSVKCVPKEIQATLARFDSDGNGVISPLELARAADLYEASKNQVKRLMKLTVGLMVMLLLSLLCIGVLVFCVVELTKETKADSSGMVYVAGTKTPTASAVATQTKTLFSAPTAGLAELSAVTSLTLSAKDGSEHFGYTITGFSKDTNLAEVTFFSSRGDRILVSASKITVSEACTPVAPATSCAGRKLLELSKSDLEASRRLMARRLEALQSNGRRLSSHQVRRLQRDMVTEPGFSVPMRVAAEHSQKEEEMCPDGTFKAPGLECAPSCEDNLPLYCPTEKQILWLSQTTNIDYTDDPEAMECACPVACPEGTEFCRPQHAGLVCDRYILPFMKSDSCSPVCSGWRDSATGRCITPCGDPSGTSAFEDEKDTKCPKPCPDRKTGPAANAMEQGKPESAMWVSPSQEYPADQVIEKLCPKICSSGDQVWGPDFTCPIECLDDSGKKIKETGSNETLKAWPSKGADGNPILEESVWDSRYKRSKFFWPWSENANKTAAEILKLTCPIVCNVKDPSTQTDIVLYPPMSVCPVLCADGTLNWQGEGSCPEAPEVMVDCPGKPSYCEGMVVQMLQSELESCPTTCNALRQCTKGVDGLIWPGGTQKCPIPCYEAGGIILLTDSGGKVFFDWGSGPGCPMKCPAMVDGNGIEIAVGPPTRRLDKKLHSTHRQLAEARKLQMGYDYFSWGPTYICPIPCYNTNGTVMYEGWGPFTILPSVSVKVGDTWQEQRLGTTDQESRDRFCPLKCPSADMMMWPEWKDDVLLGAFAPTAPKVENCPEICSDGRWAYPKWGDSCSQALDATSASTWTPPAPPPGQVMR
ncbi:unnamed protein product [Polarella glacialis]|uniref:EF-hand domain-containing protein n=1 Tax=Polarella glacialis TaxID=89957 RepID=A0A813KW04_POLGL|nr:unnamed protein product [Polarella glacialis]